MDSVTAFFAARPELPQLLFFGFAIGFAFWARSHSMATTTRTRHLAAVNRRPGWIARRRARGGIRHRHGRVGVGYVSATRSVHLTARELASHGFVVGGPG